MVEAYLVAGQPLPTLKLSTTVPIDGVYRFEDVAVGSATVAVALLDDRGDIEERYPYGPHAKGVYGPLDGEDVVQPSRRYSLEVDVPGADETIRAVTLVPGDFRVIAFDPDTVVYQATDRLEILATKSTYPGRQSFYIAKLQVADTTFGLTPFYRDLVDEGEEDAATLMENSSGIVNEAYFTHNPDGSLTLPLPWIAVAFYGPNQVVINAIDDNVYDFVRSQRDNENENRSPGEIDNVIDHIEGGRGVFGSMVRDSIQVVVWPPR
jgi:hypothetical protein